MKCDVLCCSVIASNTSGNPMEFLPFLTKIGPLKRKIHERYASLSPMLNIVMVRRLDLIYLTS